MGKFWQERKKIHYPPPSFLEQIAQDIQIAKQFAGNSKYDGLKLFVIGIYKSLFFFYGCTTLKKLKVKFSFEFTSIYFLVNCSFLSVKSNLIFIVILYKILISMQYVGKTERGLYERHYEHR